MTSPSESPGNDQAGGPDATPTGDAGTQQSAEPQLSEAEQYNKRVREDPEFALDQVSKFRSENSRLANLAGKFKSLGPIIDQIGGESQIINDLTRFRQLQNNPAMAKFIERFETTGTLPTMDGYDYGSEYEEEDPQVKALKDQIGTLQNRLENISGKVGRASVQNMMSQIKSDPMYADDFNEIVGPAIQKQVDEWESTPSGRELLSNLSIDHLQTIATVALGKRIKDVGKRLYERELQQRKAGSTDAPSSVVSTGEPGQKYPKGHTPVGEAIDDFLRQEGIS